MGVFPAGLTPATVSLHQELKTVHYESVVFQRGVDKNLAESIRQLNNELYKACGFVQVPLDFSSDDDTTKWDY